MRARGAELLIEADCVVPVPLHWRREYSRGFNQARELARHLGPPVVEALTRRRHTRAQVELAAYRRRANVAGAFSLRQRWFRQPRICGLKILLIDDVSTTGATLGSCARVLQDSGASEVFALTAAKVPIRRREPLRMSGPVESYVLNRHTHAYDERHAQNASSSFEALHSWRATRPCATRLSWASSRAAICDRECRPSTCYKHCPRLRSQNTTRCSC